ncbi:MAG: hypothetical protein JW795_24125 [Chitinivibrionales bacterium]|nr:hypothetical protein [Chitinivibrionales bacterium]
MPFSNDWSVQHRSSTAGIWIVRAITDLTSEPAISEQETRKDGLKTPWDTSRKTSLPGLVIPDFSALNPAARMWMDTIANVRIHGFTHEKPITLFEKEKSALRPLSALTYDISAIRQLHANNRFHVCLDSNRYSVPVRYANTLLTAKANALYIRGEGVETNRNEEAKEPLYF